MIGLPVNGKSVIMRSIVMEVRRKDQLLRCAGSYLGMIAEVRMKATLMSEKYRNREDDDVTQEEWESVRQSIIQMHDDLDKYSHKLDKVFEELSGHGVFSDME